MKTPLVKSTSLVLLPTMLGVVLAAHQLPAAPRHNPIALHPENPHYFLWRGQPTILVTSGEHYGALLNLDFVRKVVGELREFDNLYYEVCNEPYERRTEMAWQHRIVDTIVAAEREFASKHLISMNIANGRKKIGDPHPAVSIFNFHYCVPPDTVEMNFGLNRVIGENETGFRGRDDVLYRTEGWDFLIAGGGLYNNLDYSFTPQHPEGGFLDYQSPGGGSSALRQQLGVLKAFLHRFDFVKMRPDNSVIREVSDRLSAAALVKKGEAYALYLHVPIPAKAAKPQEYLRDGIRANLVVDLPEGRYRSEWVNTLTGRVEKQETIDHKGGNRRLVSPGFANDIALRIRRR